MLRGLCLMAVALVVAVPASTAAEAGPDKLIILLRAEGCSMQKLEGRLAKTGRAMARDARTTRVSVDQPVDPERNLDMMGKPSAIIAALEVSAGYADLPALARKARRKLGSACSAQGYLVHERRLMTRPRNWALGEPSPEPKVLTTLKRKSGISRDMFVHEWTGPHAELSLAWRRARGGDGHYVQNIVVEALGEGTPQLDGIGEIESAGNRQVGDEERKARLETAAHARSFQDMEDSAMFVAREFILKD